MFLIVFGGGFFVMACGILRCALILLVCAYACRTHDPGLIVLLGSCQRCPASWLLGCTRNLRGRGDRQYSHDLSTFPTTSQKHRREPSQSLRRQA